MAIQSQVEKPESAAYWHAYWNHTEPGFDLEYYQEIACKNSYYAYLYASNILGADIEYCQKHACKDPYHAYCFACHVPGADIEYCRKACGLYVFWLNEINKMLIKKAML